MGKHPELSVKFHSRGRSVYLTLIPDGNDKASSSIMVKANGGGNNTDFRIIRDGRTIAQSVLRTDINTGNFTVYIPPSAIATIDDPPAGAEVTYTIELKRAQKDNGNITNVQLLVVEL